MPEAKDISTDQQWRSLFESAFSLVSMAPLKIIGGGFGRTGTDSLRTALSMLGYHTHHMKSFREEPGITDPSVFKRAYEHPEEPVDWDQVYEGFDSAVDWPSVSFFDRLVEAYPDAKVILTVRSADSWYTSVKNTIWGRGRNPPPHLPDNPVFQRQIEMCHALILDGAFHPDSDAFLDEEAMKKKFVEHNEHVKATIPPDRLLVMELGEGWERLCAFLGKEVPDVPYPNVNSTKEMWARDEERRKKQLEEEQQQQG